MPKALVMCREQLSNLYKDAAEAKKRGEKIGWSTSVFPQEIAETLGIYVLYPENHSAGVASRHQAEPYLQYAEGEQEYNNDICSYAKINFAYWEIGGEATYMPKPDFLLCATNICIQVIKWYENLSEQYNIPLFMFDTAFNHESEVSESRIKYMRVQLENLIKDLCDFTGKSFDKKKFEEVMEISETNKDLYIKATDLLANVPSPLNGFDLFNYMSCMVCCRGKKSTTDILNQLIEDIGNNLEKGTSTYPVKEQYRVFWEGIACWPHLKHSLGILQKYGINVVATSYVRGWALDYNKNDLDGLVRAYSYTTSNNVPIELIIERRSELLKRFKCDGMIYHANRSCKIMNFQQYELQRRISENTGIPFTAFDGDQSDFRNYSEAQFETRIEAFKEIMEKRKEALKNG
jgi:benzoyl-CoA reductase/2-hydroxyglutaryl-CoA dehydratase subunit BcrC/BadD/HgdB